MGYRPREAVWLAVIRFQEPSPSEQDEVAGPAETEAGKNAEYGARLEGMDRPPFHAV
jgi:hypothetical protein